MSYYTPIMYVTTDDEMLWFFIGLVAGIVFMALVDFMIDRKVRRNGRVCSDYCRKDSKRSEERNGGGVETGVQEQHHHPKLDLHQFKR